MFATRKAKDADIEVQVKQGHPEQSVIVYHLKGDSIESHIDSEGNKHDGEDGMQLLFITIEGYAEHPMKQIMFRKTVPEHQTFIKTTKPIQWSLKMGTKENPVENTQGHPHYCIAFQVVPGPNDFGDIDSPFASKEQIAKWVLEKYIPCVDDLDEWKKEGPHLNSPNWYNEIKHVSQILDRKQMCELLHHGFCQKPNEFANNISNLFKMSKACIYAMYPKGELTEEFIGTFRLQKVHLLPEDYATVPPPKPGSIEKFLSPTKSATNTTSSAEPTASASAAKNQVTPGTATKPSKDGNISDRPAKRGLDMTNDDGLEDTDDDSIGPNKKAKTGLKTTGLSDLTDDDKSIQENNDEHSLMDVQNLQQSTQDDEDNVSVGANNNTDG